MKKILLFLCFVCSVIEVSAQDNKKLPVEFDNTTWDFGTIKEKDGKQIHVFEYKNVSGKPFVITNVTSSCGCTTPNYSKKPLMPGKSEKLTVIFDPEGKPGKNRRQITVIDTDKNLIQITILANVIEKEKTPDEVYPLELEDGLRANISSIFFDVLNQGGEYSKKIDFYNGGKNPIKLDAKFLKKNDYISLKLSHSILKPKERGQLTITYSLKNAKTLGNHSTPIALIINGKESARPIPVTASIAEDFSSLSAEEIDSAPRSSMSFNFQHFGNVKKGVTRTMTFAIKNSGQRDLLIREVICSDNLKCEISPKTIKNGQEGEISLTFKPGNNSGRSDGLATIVVNDPKFPVHEIRVVANVE